MSRDFQLPGRSAVIACEGMAATSHPLASLAAIEALRAGGNAADAAVTAVAPAIHYAERGFPVAARIAWDWAREVGKLRADAGAARHFLFDGLAPAEGDVVKLPALARTLRTIAAKGPRAFYEGPIADDIV